MIRKSLHSGICSSLALVSAPVLAAHGITSHGFGAKSSGAGGVGYVAAEDSYPLSANPALAYSLKDRIDFGVEGIAVYPGGTIENNLLGRDQEYESGRRYFAIPQFGFARPVSERLAIGMSAFSAGFGTDYKRSPYERFGGSPRLSASLGQLGVSTVIAYALRPNLVFGAGLNLAYQTLDVKGLDVFTAFSESPKKFTNQGTDGAAGAGVVVGVHALPFSWLELGAAYRSTTWTQRFTGYAGLLPDGGRLQLPAFYGAGLALMPSSTLTIALEVQRALYGEEKATGNGFDEFLAEGHRLGSKDGPGFGWNNIDIFKLGITWVATPALRLRAGYSYNTQLLESSDTLLAFIAPNSVQQHFTAGATIQLARSWELSGFAVATPEDRFAGDHSIPLLVGGGEANLKQQFIGLGFSVGRRLD